MTNSRCAFRGRRGNLGAWWRQAKRGTPATSKRRGALALSRSLYLPHPQCRMPARRLIRRNRQSRVQRSCFLYDSRSPEVPLVLIFQMSVTRKRSWSNLSSVVSPVSRGRAVALRIEPLSKAQRLARSGGHPSLYERPPIAKTFSCSDSQEGLQLYIRPSCSLTCCGPR